MLSTTSDKKAKDDLTTLQQKLTTFEAELNSCIDGVELYKQTLLDEYYTQTQHIHTLDTGGNPFRVEGSS